MQAHQHTHTDTHTLAVIRTLCKIKSDRSQIESEINCRLCGCPTKYWVKCWLLLLPRLLLLLLLLLLIPLALVKSKSNNNWSQTHCKSWLESSLTIAFNSRRKPKCIQYSLSKLFVICKVRESALCAQTFASFIKLICNAQNAHHIIFLATFYGQQQQQQQPWSMVLCALLSSSLFRIAHRFRTTIQSVSHSVSVSLPASQSGSLAVCQSLSQFSRFWISAPATTTLDTTRKLTAATWEANSVATGSPSAFSTILSFSVYFCLSLACPCLPYSFHSFIHSHIQREQRRLWSANCWHC